MRKDKEWEQKIIADMRKDKNIQETIINADRRKKETNPITLYKCRHEERQKFSGFFPSWNLLKPYVKLHFKYLCILYVSQSLLIRSEILTNKY